MMTLIDENTNGEYMEFVEPTMNSADKLWELKKLEYKRDEAEKELHLLYIDGEDVRRAAATVANCCTDISELLKDE